jgi:hypothetical protein
MRTGLLDAHLRQTGQAEPEWLRMALQPKAKYEPPVDMTSGASLAPGVLEKAEQFVPKSEPVQATDAAPKPEAKPETAPQTVAPARTGEVPNEPTNLLSDALAAGTGWKGTESAKVGSTLTVQSKSTEKPKGTTLDGLFQLGSGWSGAAMSAPASTGTAKATETTAETPTEQVEAEVAPAAKSAPAISWTEGDKHWTEGVDPVAAQSLYEEMQGITGRLPPELQKQLWATEGFGSQQKNMQAFVGDLQRKGVTSLADLQVVPRDIMEQANFTVRSDGSVVRLIDQGEYNQEQKLTGPELAAIQALPEYTQALEQIKQDRLGESGGNAGFSASVPTGKQTGSLINSRTGEVIDDNKDNSPLEQGFFVGKTSAGKGKTHFNLIPVPTEDGYKLIPATEYKATGFNKFKQDFGPALGMLSLAFGMPGVAASMGTAGAVASTALKGFSVANAIDNKDWLGAIAGATGMVPGVNQVAGLGMSADTLKTVKNVGTAAKVANSAKKGDVIGALSGGATLTGGLLQNASLIEAGKTLGNVKKGVNLVNAAKNGNVLQVAAAAGGWK